jgi:hypothetical protein
MNSEGLDLVIHNSRADAEQFGGVLLDPVRHLQSFDDSLSLDLRKRHACGRNIDWLADVWLRHRERFLGDLAAVLSLFPFGDFPIFALLGVRNLQDIVPQIALNVQGIKKPPEPVVRSRRAVPTHVRRVSR